MIYGIGVDTATVSRIEKSIQSSTFMQRVFGEDERILFEKKHNKPETIAANFAAKEAFGKALGTGITGFNWHEVQALRSENGAPYYKFCGSVLDIMTQKRLTAHISITHEGDFATVFTIIETEEEENK